MSLINVMYVKKGYVWNPATCNCENRKYLASIMEDSAIICTEVIDVYTQSQTAKQTLMERKQRAICKHSIFYLDFS